MTSSDSGSDRRATAEEWPDEDIEAAEREAAEDDAADGEQRARSTLVGAVVVLVAIVLTVIGVVSVVARVSELPDTPGVVQQMPAPPPTSP